MRRNARPGYRRVEVPVPSWDGSLDLPQDRAQPAGSACRYDAVMFEALRGSRARRIVALVAVVSVATAAIGAQAAQAADAASRVTALSVASTGPALAVQGSDGKVHLDYDLVLTSMFDVPITLVSIDVLAPSGRRLLRLEGDSLAAVTHPNFGGLDQLMSTVPPSATVGTELDVVV